jgi:hypothetical protein
MDALENWFTEPKAKEFLKKLNMQSDHELDCILANTDDYRLYYAQESERKRFFNQSDCDADFTHWGRQIVWSIDEGIALIFGKDPRKVYWENIKEYVNYSPFAKNFEEIRGTAKKYVDFKQLFDPVTPSIFLTWVQRMNFINVNVPQKLIESVAAIGVQLADWQTHYKNMEQGYIQLEAVYKQAMALIVAKNELIEIKTKNYEQLQQENEALRDSPDSKKTLLNIIGVLLKTMLATTDGGQKISCFDTQSSLIEYLVNNFSVIKGISKSNLEEKFSKSNQLIDKVKKPQLG